MANRRKIPAEFDPAAAYFLGPKGENVEFLKGMLARAVDGHVAFRKAYIAHTGDQPDCPSPKDRRRTEFKTAQARLRKKVDALIDLMRFSAPLANFRSHGHMHWDHALPGTIGYLLGLLYNQNNVAAEASPVTTWLEMQEALRLCRMLGFRVASADKGAKAEIGAWGHLTCDGSVANIEAAWAARNARFFAVAVREAARATGQMLAVADRIEVEILTRDPRKPVNEATRAEPRKVKLLALDDWQALNLPLDQALELPQRFIDAMLAHEGERRSGLEAAARSDAKPLDDHGKAFPDQRLPPLDEPEVKRLVWNAISARTIEAMGPVEFYRAFLPNAGSPMLIVPASGHYSWPKAANVLGLGAPRFVRIDEDARMDVIALREALEEALRWRRPVVAVVAVLGSTAESSVDPLAEICKLKSEFARRGLEFWLHADAAWGGYFRATVRTLKLMPEAELAGYAQDQLREIPCCDSVTVDPHKAGYVPYPAGALCYRNGACKNLVTLSADVVQHTADEPSVGVFGLEGSKPGAAATAVYLTHEMLGASGAGDASALGGYGPWLRECIWTSKRLYARLHRLFGPDDAYRIVMFRKTPRERKGGAKLPAGFGGEGDVFAFLAQAPNADIVEKLKADPGFAEFFYAIGGDLNIVNYAFNFRCEPSGEWNRDAERCAHFNKLIFRSCSTQPSLEKALAAEAKKASPATDPGDCAYGGLKPPIRTIWPDIVITNSSYEAAVVGQDLIDDFGGRLGLRDVGATKLQFLISTTMNPWLTDDGHRKMYLDTFAKTLKDTVAEVGKAMRKS